MMYECRATHTLWVICDIEWDGDVPVYIWLEERSRLSHIWPNFKIQKYLLETHLCCPALSQDYNKKHFVLQLEMLKIRFKTVTSSVLPGPSRCTAQIRIIVWSFVRWLLAYSFITYTYSVFCRGKIYCCGFKGIYICKVKVWKVVKKIEN